jgi:GH15 family glucan-1,4-alpha-glucosidase
MENKKFNIKNKSNINSNNCTNTPLIPIITYNNVDTNKCTILEENKGKSGVYRLINNFNNKSYIGSSTYLSNEFNNYYYLNSLTLQVKGSIIISRALLKYGYKNFSLDILEYCESNMLIKREQYYIDLLKPEYNILRIYKNNLGSKHS